MLLVALIQTVRDKWAGPHSFSNMGSSKRVEEGICIRNQKREKMEDGREIEREGGGGG